MPAPPPCQPHLASLDVLHTFTPPFLYTFNNTTPERGRSPMKGDVSRRMGTGLMAAVGACGADGSRHRRHATVRCRKRDEICDRALCFPHKVRGYLRREIIKISHRIYPMSHISSLLMLRNVNAEVSAANRPPHRRPLLP